MTIRPQRVAALVREEIAGMLSRGEVKDPRITGLISISDVEMSRDLQHATIFFTRHGPPEDLIRIQQALEHAAGFIRGQLAKRLSLRLAPHVHFKPDTSFEQGERIERLLATLPEPGADDGEGNDGEGDDGEGNDGGDGDGGGDGGGD